jgi:hypothetical protein
MFESFFTQNDYMNENDNENCSLFDENIEKYGSPFENLNEGIKKYFFLNANNNSTNNSSNPNSSININDSQNISNESIKEENGKIVGVELLKPKKKNRKNKNKKDKNENNQNEKAKNTNQGRKTKEESKTSTSKRNKFAKDNIFRKIKTNFINDFIINLINAKIKSVFGYQKYLVRKFNREIVTDVTIRFNLNLFDLQLRNLLNKNISDKYTTVNSNANKEILEKLEMNENFDKILNFTVKEAYEIFLSEDYEEIISMEFEIDKQNIKFNNMKGVINKLRDEENEDDVYLRELEHYFLNIYSLMDESKIRKQRKEKLKLDD